MSLVINKFGGGIMNEARAITHLPEVFAKCVTGNSINVCSAFGKTTNNLEKLAREYVMGDTSGAEQTLKELKSFHLHIVSELFPGEHIVHTTLQNIFENVHRTLVSVGDSSDTAFISDQIVPFGEILASVIISNYFSLVGIPNKLVYATDVIKTDTHFGSANVDTQTTLENLKSEITPEILQSYTHIITQGFIGFADIDEKNKTTCWTTLGREGSDYTAGLLGNLMNAEKVVLWKDVPGVMNKNPKLPGGENAEKIDSITYDDFEILLHNGATGLVHPKTLGEVKEKKIPLQVRPFWDLAMEGTFIG